MLKAIIKLNYSCNNNCLFCHAKPKRNFKDLEYAKVKDKIDLIKNKVDCVLFSGGEPTLRKDLLKILNYANKQKLITGLITNSRMFSLDNLFSKMAKYNLKYIYTTFHSHDKSIHDRITNTKSFEQTVKGIKNLIGQKIFLLVNIVIIKDNLKTLDKTVDFLKELGVNNIKLSFVEPLTEEDMEHTPDIKIASKKVKEILDRENKIKIGWDGFPLCIMKGYENRKNDMVTNNIKYISEILEKDFYLADEGNRIKMPLCKNCKKISMCDGVYQVYARYRDPGLSPY